jgi:hypothetical protein
MPSHLQTPSNAPVFASIAATLERDPLSGDILRFLLKNQAAMDSAKGIAAWWVRKDELAVRPSLDRLFACGAIVAHTLSSGITVYGLSQNPDIRIWLRKALAVPDASEHDCEPACETPTSPRSTTPLPEPRG